MTYTDLKQYYADLLILQYKGSPRAYATIEATADILLTDNLLLAVQDAFNLDTAVGTQLDMLGKYIGISRNLFDFSGSITLTDTVYRQLLKVKIALNSSGSSLDDIQDLLDTYFSSILFVTDFRNMRLAYLMVDRAGNELAQLLIKSGLLPKPMGVQLAVIIYLPVVTTKFAFRTTTSPLVRSKGFNTTLSYDMSRPWINKNDVITV